MCKIKLGAGVRLEPVTCCLRGMQFCHWATATVYFLESLFLPNRIHSHTGNFPNNRIISILRSPSRRSGLWKLHVHISHYFHPFRYKDLDYVPNGFSVFVGHEFLDALPVRQFKRMGPGDSDWREVPSIFSYTGLGYTGIRAHTGPREFQSRAQTAHSMFCTQSGIRIYRISYIPDSKSSAQPT